jgi:hypothetical protein
MVAANERRGAVAILRAVRLMKPYGIALALTLAFFCAAEAMHPYFFLQDDNRDQYLPFLAYNYRVAADGQIALYNYYQSLGRPHLAAGIPCTLHPVGYATFFLSQRLFHHPFAAIDLMVLFYMLVGAAGMVALARMIGLSDAAAVFAAVTWTLFPLNVNTMQSWMVFAPIVGFLPWMIRAALDLCGERPLRGGAVFVVTHVLIFFVGGQQFSVYAALVQLGIALLVAAQRRRVVTRFALASVATGVLAAPLLLPMWRVMQQSQTRSRGMTMEELIEGRITPLQLLNGLFDPFRRLYAPSGGNWFVDWIPVGDPHIGYLTLALLAAYPLARRRIAQPTRRVLDACGIVAIICFAGALGGWSVIVYWLPLLNRFRWPFKLMPYALAPATLCAAAVLDWRVAGRRWLAIGAVALQFANLALVDLSFEKQGFAEFMDKVPIYDPLAPRLAGQRIVAIGCGEAAGKDRLEPPFLLDYATLYRIYAFGGYDPLVSARTARATFHLNYPGLFCSKASDVPLNYFRVWGVHGYVLDLPIAADIVDSLRRRGLRSVYKDPERMLMIDPYAAPLTSAPNCRTSMRQSGDDLLIDTDCRAPSELTVRFLFHPDFVATIDGRATTVEPNAADQIAVALPAGRHRVHIDYVDVLFELGLTIAAIGGGVVLAALAVALRRRRALRRG